MSLMNMILQLAAAPGQALPVEPLQAAVAAVTPSPGLNYWELITHASLPVQIIIALLAVASVFSWVIIFSKMRVYARAN